MALPYKRRRISGNGDPDADLQQRRKRNDSRLKSIFESIFDKYGKDFDGIGDEIDLETGEIVVNNGHLLGMSNEGDVGEAESPAGNLESDYSSSYPSGEEHSREAIELPDGEVAGSLRETGAAATTSKLGTLWQHGHDAESLMWDTDGETPSATFGKSLLSQVDDYGSEEDELADSAVKWMSPREARAITYRKWRLPEDGPAFVDEETLDPAWRAPPLPKSTLSHPGVEGGKMAASVDAVREHSHQETSSTSVWAPKVERRRDLRTVKPTRSSRSPSVVQIEYGRGKTSHNSTLPRNTKRAPAWTREEDDDLRHLKATSSLMDREVEEFCPERHQDSICTKWSDVVCRSSVHRTLNEHVHQERRRISPLVPTKTNFSLGFNQVNNAQRQYQHQHQRQQYLETNAPFSNRFMTNKVPNDSYKFVSEPGNPVESFFDGYLNRDVQDSQDTWISGTHDTGAQDLSPNALPFPASGQHLPEDSKYRTLTQYYQSDHEYDCREPIQLGLPPAVICERNRNIKPVETGVYMQQGQQQPYCNHTQLAHARSPVPTHPLEDEDDVAGRREKCVDKLVHAGYDVVVSQKAALSQDESKERIIKDEPASDSAVGLFPYVDDSQSQIREVAPSNATQTSDAVDTSPAALRQKQLLLLPISSLPRGEGPSLELQQKGSSPPAGISSLDKEEFSLVPRKEEPFQRPTVSLPHEERFWSTRKERQSFPLPASSPTYGEKLSLPRCQRSGRIRRRVGTANTMPVDRRIIVQVVVPDSKPYKVSKQEVQSETRASLHTPTTSCSTVAQLPHKEVLLPIFHENVRSPAQFDGAPSKSEMLLGLEIPDSQPETSSPIAECKEDFSPSIANSQHLSKVSPLCLQPSKPSDCLTVASTVVLDLDELAVVPQSTRKRKRTSFDSVVAYTEPLNNAISMSRWPRNKQKTRVAKNLLAGSFSAITTEMLDCGDDELSSM